MIRQVRDLGILLNANGNAAGGAQQLPSDSATPVDGKRVSAGSEEGVSLFLAISWDQVDSYDVTITDEYGGPDGRPDTDFGKAPVAFYSNADQSTDVTHNVKPTDGSDVLMQLSGSRYSGTFQVHVVANCGVKIPSANDKIKIAGRSGSGQ